MSGELKVDIISSSTNGQDVQVDGNLKVNSITPDSELIIDGPVTVESEMSINNIQEVEYYTSTDLKNSKILMNHGTNNKVSAISALDALIPPGTIFPFAGDIIPEGWLPCDGRFITISANVQDQFFRLYIAIGKKWGTNETETEFRIPDLRGRFLRGVDDGQENDPDANDRRKLDLNGFINDEVAGDTVGSYQEDSFQSHEHSTSIYHWSTSTSGNLYPSYGNNTSNGSEVITNNIITGSRTSSETRPQNAAVNYIIKY